MSIGIYGSIRPADVNLKDVDVFISYNENRGSLTTNSLTKVNTNDFLEKVTDPENSDVSLAGLYNLKLSSSVFNARGIYNIYIKPKEIRTKITDCGVLAALPNVKGVVLSLKDLPNNSDVISNGGLTGYRVDYLSETLSKDRRLPNQFKIVTSSNFVEPITDNLSSVSQKGIKYRFNDNSNLLFLTLSPTSQSNIKPNVQPFLGNIGQEIILSNTLFNPLLVEVEVTEFDIETLGYGILGNQSKDIKNGIYTIYDTDGEIYKQYKIYETTNSQGRELEIKEELNNPTDINLR